MSFPTTSALDNFNRANENPLSGGGSWTISGTFDAPFQLFSNTVIGTSGSKQSQMSYVAAGDLTDCEVFATVVTVPGSGNVIGVIARQDPSVDTGKNYYDCLYVTGVGILIDYYDSAGTTNTLATYAQTVNAGDSIGLSVIGTTLTAWYKPSGGSWTNLGSVTDTNLTHGYIGVTGFPLVGGGKLDDFGGGVVAAVDSDTVGGITSVSSLDENPDQAIVGGISTPVNVEEYGRSDTSTITSRTTISITEVVTTETLVVLETSTGLSVGDTVSFVVSSTTVTTTSTTDIPPPPPTDITYAVNITTTDYDNLSWITAYSYNSAAAVIAGTVANFDGDNGLIGVSLP